MISVEKLTKRYGSLEAVSEVSFRIGRGEIVGLLGPNGAGKTTILRCLTCYHLPSAGTAIVAGFDVRTSPVEVKKRVGYLPENAPLYADLSVREYLDFIADARLLTGGERASRLDECVERCAIGDVLDRPIGVLSKGYRQRVGVAQAIIHRPELLILDEPTTGLDPNQIVEMRTLIGSIGKDRTVIVSTHILAEVEAVCGRALIVAGGRIIADGEPRKIARKVAGGVRYRAELKGKNVSKTALGSCPVIEEVLSVETDAGRTVVEFLIRERVDASERLFDWLIAAGYKILSMAPVEMSLEEAFTRLTRGKGSEG